MLKMGSTIGILGGGQLAKMLAVAASRIGYKTHIFDPNPESPAFEIAYHKTIASFNDNELLKKFAETSDVVTYEFENIPKSSLDTIEKFAKIYPSKNALWITQDRILEKRLFTELKLNTVKFASINSYQDFVVEIAKVKTPAILKTCRGGYDGKGQLLISKNTKKSDVENHLLYGPCILESFVNFNTELSVIIARNEYGDVASFDPGDNVHKSGVLRSTTVPSQTSKRVQLESIILAGKIINDLKYVGVLGVELFLDIEGKIIVNEIAPRVHNSGHWTQNGCVIDQFEQHIRAISGHRLGNGERHSNVKMVNILGTDIDSAFKNVDAAVHLYGKKEVRAGRKMGHINYVSKRS